MSKPVRLPDYLHAEVERLAKAEKRSLANMVKVLLEQALKLDKEGLSPITDEAGQVVGVAAPGRRVVGDPHFKPDFK